MKHDYGFTINEFTGEMRFLEKSREDEIGQIIHSRVLQQKVLDGWGNPVWVDVPLIEDETD